MKFARCFLLAGCLLVLIYALIYLGVNFVFQGRIKAALETGLGSCVNARVKIKNLRTNLLNYAQVNNVEIQARTTDALISLNSARVRIMPALLLFTSRLRGRLEIKGLNLSGPPLDLPPEAAVDFSFKAHLPGRSLDIESVVLYLGSTPCARLDGRLEPMLKPAKGTVNIRVESFSSVAFGLKGLDMRLGLAEGGMSGRLSAESFSYGKFSPADIVSEVLFEKNRVGFKNLKLSLFSGTIEGDAAVSFSGKTAIDFDLGLSDISLEEVTGKLASADWQASGEMSGYIKAQLEADNFRDLKGRLYSTKPGAVNMAAIKRLLASGPAIIEKNLPRGKEFAYDSLASDISLLEGNIIVKLALTGKSADFDFDLNIDPQVITSYFQAGGG